ncbi:hypothetical protein [Teichococcus aestuarii]|uniref:hypothetical protein n=1 Tax=Teichococcus aestuarii TaxID=568898 RepID=UPI00361D9772
MTATSSRSRLDARPLYRQVEEILLGRIVGGTGLRATSCRPSRSWRASWASRRALSARRWPRSSAAT